MTDALLPATGTSRKRRKADVVPEAGSVTHTAHRQDTSRQSLTSCHWGRIALPTMSEPTGQAAGFWSYTHQDNDQDDGRILRLSERIRAEYSLLTGDDLNLFVDREGIAWGNEWRQRIDGALDLTAFFIPVVTPRYFTRDECRRELLRFATQARALGVEDLLLPIYYVHVMDLREDSNDEAMALVARTQYADWRDLRLLDESSAEYRQAVNALARRLAEVAASVAARPTPEIVPSSSGDGDGDDEPGYMDVLAQAESAMPQWAETIQEFPDVLTELGQVTESATEDVARSDKQGKGFAGRVHIARRLAGQYLPIADTLQELGQRYSTQLREIDPAILFVIRSTAEQIAANQLAEEDKEAAAELFAQLRELIDASENSVQSLRSLIESIAANMGISRDLRPALKRLNVALRNVVDAHDMIAEWRRRVDELPPLD